MRRNNAKRWTPGDNEQVMRLWRRGKTGRQIANIMNRTYYAVGWQIGNLRKQFGPDRVPLRGVTRKPEKTSEYVVIPRAGMSIRSFNSKAELNTYLAQNGTESVLPCRVLKTRTVVLVAD